jgi:hypothetical protein
MASRSGALLNRSYGSEHNCLSTDIDEIAAPVYGIRIWGTEMKLGSG